MPTQIQRGPATLRYTINTSDGRFTVQAYATGVLSAFGHNPTIAIRDYEGEVQVADESFDKASLSLVVQMSAMEVLDDMKKDDRQKLEDEMYQKVLEVKRFPTATFTSKAITVQNIGNGLFQAHVVGELTFHGVKRNHLFDARVTSMAASMRISGEFSIRQSDYGIKAFSVAGGALRLKDDLKFKFELVAQKQG
jgi:polyisoprenoid-binding protein YceI